MWFHFILISLNTLPLPMQRQWISPEGAVFYHYHRHHHRLYHHMTHYVMEDQNRSLEHREEAAETAKKYQNKL